MDLISQYNQTNTPGAALLVMQNWKIIYQQTHGLASVEHRIPVTPATTFRLASVTKHFTATCILLLAEKGLLRLSDTLNIFFSDAPLSWAAVTVQNLLNHTGGICDYEKLIPDNYDWQLSDHDVYNLVRQREKTEFAPWHRFSYSNTWYCLLSLIVEKVSGISFWDSLHENIFKPLAMNSTLLYRNNGEGIENRAYGYKDDEWKFVFKDQWPTTATSGDGWIYSCLDDMQRWLAALDNAKILSKESLNHMFSPTLLTTGESYNYGCGWEITKYKNHPAYYHGGATSGFRNFVYRIPHLGISAVFLSNRDSGWGEVFAQEIIDRLL